MSETAGSRAYLATSLGFLLAWLVATAGAVIQGAPRLRKLLDDDFGGSLPAFTQFFLDAYLWICVGAFVVSCALVVDVLRRRAVRSAHATSVFLGLWCAVHLLQAMAVLAFYLPIFRLAEAIG